MSNPILNQRCGKCQKEEKNEGESIAFFTCGHSFCYKCIKNSLTLNQVLKYKTGSTISIDCLDNKQNCLKNGYFILQLFPFLQFLVHNSNASLNYNEMENIYSSKIKNRNREIERTITNLSRTYKEKILNDINLTANKIDVLILFLHESKNEYKSKMEKVYENYNSILKIVQILLLESKYYNDNNQDCIKLLNENVNFTNDIDSEIKEQSESIFNYLSKEIKNLKNFKENSKSKIQHSTLNNNLNITNYNNNESLFSCEVEKVGTSNIENIFYGHTNTIWTLIELNDTTIASGSYDNSICIWNMNNHEAIQTLNKHKSKITKLFLIHSSEDEGSKSSSVFASGSADTTIIIWCLSSNNQYIPIETLYGHTSTINSIIQYNNDKLISSAVEIIIWDISKKYSIVSILSTYKYPVTTLCNLELGNGFVSASFENIYIWNNKLKCIDIIKTSAHYVTCLCYVEDTQFLISGAYDKCIKIWKEGKCLKSLKEHTNTVWGIFIINSVKLCSSSSNEIIIWDMNKFISLVVIEEDNYALTKLNNGKFAYGCYDNKIKILNTNDFLS